MENPVFFYNNMLKRMIGSTSTSSNIQELMKDDSNFDRSMTMDTMKMNHDCSSEGSCNTILNK